MKNEKNSPSAVLHRFASTLARGKATTETADGVPPDSMDVPIKIPDYLSKVIDLREGVRDNAWISVPRYGKAGAEQLVEWRSAP